MATAEPIFIHSLFRSASTYFFQKFRSVESFCCYQEPFNESLAALNHSWRHYRLLGSAAHPQPLTGLRHPLLDRPYFYEFWEAREHLHGLFRRSFAYGHYFASGAQLPAQQHRWLSTIIEHAPARPVLQFCRSSGRVMALRELYGGVHLHLWREPRVQWWSYKVAGYFDSVSQRIYRCAQLPAALREVRRLAGIGRLHSQRLAPRANYLMFYGLWLDAWLRLSAHSDLSTNIDRIALSPAENAACSLRLAALIGRTIDLSDIRASGMAFTPEEEPFYTQVEDTVNAVFAQHSQTGAQNLQGAIDAAHEARRAHDGRDHDAMAEQNLRLAAQSLMECLAGGRPGGRDWPRRWYPRRLHDYVRWSWQGLQQRRRTQARPQEAHRGGYAMQDGPGCQAAVETQPSGSVR
jgi:hypothetical protein